MALDSGGAHRSGELSNRNLAPLAVSVATMFRIRILLCTLLAASLGASALGEAPPALASHNEAVYFEAKTVLLTKARDQAIAQMQHLGVKALRVELYWVDVAPGARSARRPNFDATNPVSYNWDGYDWVLAKAKELHWQVLLTVTGPAPKWATSTKRDFVTRPDPREFERFMTAVGRHYGSEVGQYSIWNEPNHPAFLRPQFAANGKPASPRIYRALYQAGYAGLQAAGLTNPQVLLGETAPTGFTSVNVRREGRNALLHDVAPLTFLRGALCLNNGYGKAGSCGPLPAAGYAHHAYTNAAGPRYVPPGRDDVMIAVLGRLTRALDLAARARAIPAHLPIYLTEFGVQSKPNRFLGVSVAQQAAFDALAEHIAWSNPRVAAFSQYLLRDDPLGGAPGASVHGGTIGFQTGLEYVNGRPKPLYFSWPVQMSVSRHGRTFSLWGLVRPSTGATQVTILAASKRGPFRALKTVTTESLGYWSTSASARATRLRVRWVSPTGVTYEGSPISAL
jgi:hypothetical protein